jgi:acyl-CoA reductase-like NAD-dependent aldehyde dehydrogenase
MTTVAPAPVGESLFIDGRWRPAAAAFRATDPADPRRETGAYSAATAADVADAYAATAKAQPECRTRRRRRDAGFTTITTAYIRSA